MIQYFTVSQSIIVHYLWLYTFIQVHSTHKSVSMLCKVFCIGTEMFVSFYSNHCGLYSQVKYLYKHPTVIHYIAFCINEYSQLIHPQNNIMYQQENNGHMHIHVLCI